MKTAFLELGSNLGERERFLGEAKEKLNEIGVKVVEESSIYETEPVGVKEDQPWFLNQVLKVETDFAPRDLLVVCEQIERELGRDKKGELKARTIDIDILLFGEQEINDPDLIVPHPRMKKRKFVLKPLVEIAPEFEPLLNACADSATVKLYEHSTAS